MFGPSKAVPCSCRVLKRGATRELEVSFPKLILRTLSRVFYLAFSEDEPNEGVWGVKEGTIRLDLQEKKRLVAYGEGRSVPAPCFYGT